MDAPDTAYVCVSPKAHAGHHELVDAMGLEGIDSTGAPVYRARFRHAR